MYPAGGPRWVLRAMGTASSCKAHSCPGRWRSAGGGASQVLKRTGRVGSEERQFGQQCAELDVDELCSGLRGRLHALPRTAPPLPHRAPPQTELRPSTAANDLADLSEGFDY